MTKSDQIRQLAAQGMARADIARALGVRYQFVRNVLMRTAAAVAGSVRKPLATAAARSVKPRLYVDRLIAAGFAHVGCWQASDGRLKLDTQAPRQPAVYAFSIDGVVQYVGVATMGLAKRLYFYERPGATQRTSLRLNASLLELLAGGTVVEVHAAHPANGEWNRLPIDMCAGLVLGLIRQFALLWNKRSAGQRCADSLRQANTSLKSRL